MSTPLTGWKGIFGYGLAGVVLGLVVGSQINRSAALTLRTQTVRQPFAYQVAKYPGGTALRMAMLHDVLLGRYLHHGAAWYEKRNELSRQIIAEERATPGPPSLRLFDAMDDLAVGLENLHKPMDAAAVMREKLALLPPMQVEPSELSTNFMDVEKQVAKSNALTPEQRHHYTTRANLGTSLIHAAFPKIFSGDTSARDQMKEGLDLIDQSIAINPLAHFGRENWQAVVVRFFLVGAEDQDFLAKYDMVGNKLRTADFTSAHRSAGYARAIPPEFLADLSDLSTRANLRQRILLLTSDHDWYARINPPMVEMVPFDEPTLALMGMWMLGGGPNPNSALALANIAATVGQLEIAWDGYERALAMQDRFPPDPKVRQMLVEFCHSQQASIASYLAPSAAAQWTEKTRKRHRDELTWAKQYIAEYHAWEASQIAAGVPLDAPTFYDGFHHSHPSIASPVGHADEMTTVIYSPDGIIDGVPPALLLGGLFMAVAALSVRRPS